MPIYAFADYGAITIDGYYDDWEDKPITEVYHGNHPDDSRINQVSLFRDEDNVYTHILFAEYNNNYLENLNIKLYTNAGNKNYTLVFDSPWSSMDVPAEVLEQVAPADEQAAPGTDETAPADEQTAPKTDETAPADEQTAPKTDETAPADEQTAPKTDETVPADEQTAPKTDETAPADEQTAPKTDETAPADEQTAPKTDETAPADEQTAPKADATPADHFTQDLLGYNSNSDTLNSSQNHHPKSYVWSFSVYTHGRWDPVGSGYFTWTEGKPDEAEFSISLSSITSDPDAVTEISMKIPELGKQTIICVGASSGPYIGVAIGAAIALSSVGFYTYKRKKLQPAK